MYIAFKWLLGLTLTMWIAICCLDTFVKKNTALTGGGFNIRPLPSDIVENRTVPVKNKLNFPTKSIGDNHYSMTYWHCFMFISGAAVVLVYNRLNEIILISKFKLPNIFTNADAKRLQDLTKIAASTLSKFATSLYNSKTLAKLKLIAYELKTALGALRIKTFQKQRINVILLKKMKEIGEERKNLAHLLIAAIKENKNIRMQYQLENMAKRRLINHIENTEKLIKENRTRYISFQQLYLVTHQENTFLKTRLKKVTQEKADAEKNLMELIYEVYKTKNNELKSYCSRFIVNTKRNLLNTDIGDEIQQFLRNPVPPSDAISNWQFTEQPNLTLSASESWLRCSSCTQITEIFKDEVKMPIVSEAPKLKGLPGEYVWTVKDKDGLIEKLYEYDSEANFQSGDTIRRIREYSVYHDKDCLLDFSNSSTCVNDIRTTRPEMRRSSLSDLDGPVTNQRFLTGSEAFKKFMRNNENVVSTSLLPTPRLLAE